VEKTKFIKLGPKLKKYKKQKIKHCCKDMDFFLDERRVAIYYNPIYREYFIKLWSYPDGKHSIYHCPWCGCKFPKSLINEYFNTLEKEYNISYLRDINRYIEHIGFCDEIERELPEEFKSDKWWKKRNL